MNVASITCVPHGPGFLSTACKTVTKWNYHVWNGSYVNLNRGKRFSSAQGKLYPVPRTEAHWAYTDFYQLTNCGALFGAVLFQPPKYCS